MASVGITFLIAWIFYDAWYGMLLFPAVYIAFLHSYQQVKQEKENRRKSRAFKEMLEMLSGFLQAGISLENSFLQVEEQIEMLGIDGREVAVALHKMNQKVRVNIPVEKAKKEIDATFLGENKALEQVMSDVILQDAYQDGMVAAEWSFDDYTYIGTDGVIKENELDEPELVEATVVLTCGEYQQIYRFSMQLCPCSVETEKGLRREIQKKIRQQPLEKSEITLPSDIAGIPLQWKKTGNMDGAMLSILGIVVCFLLPYGQKLEEQKQKKIILEKRKKDYPMLVEELSLFLAAGVTFTEAARKMTENYERRKKQTGKVQEGYELWKKLSYEMRDGVREADAIMRFGKESGRKEYKKLALLLEQNRRQGSQHMIQQLEQENLIAFEMRKNQVKREGEEASVKLLFPMMGMLGIVIVILILPAMMTMKHL